MGQDRIPLAVFVTQALYGGFVFVFADWGEALVCAKVHLIPDQTAVFNTVANRLSRC